MANYRLDYVNTILFAKIRKYWIIYKDKKILHYVRESLIKWLRLIIRMCMNVS